MEVDLAVDGGGGSFVVVEAAAIDLVVIDFAGQLATPADINVHQFAVAHDVRRVRVGKELPYPTARRVLPFLEHPHSQVKPLQSCYASDWDRLAVNRQLGSLDFHSAREYLARSSDG